MGIMGSSHGSSPSSSRYSPLHIRSMTSDLQVARGGCTRTEESSKSPLENTSPILSSSAVATATVWVCARGGGIDDDPPRRRRGNDDRPPPSNRRSSSPHNYDRDRGYRERSSGGPSRPRGDPRGSDRRREGGPSRVPPQGERDRRSFNNRYDDDFGDGPNNRNREFRDERGRRGSYDEGGRSRNPRDYQPPDNNIDDPEEGKSKKWFSFKKDKTSNTESKKDEQTSNFDPLISDSSDVSLSIPPPPPPPPPTDASFASSTQINPAETERTPIHYMFPTAEAAAEERQSDKLDDEILGMDGSDRTGSDMDAPFLDVDDEFTDRDAMDRRRRRRVEDDEGERYRGASPRRDAVTMFMSTRKGKLQVRVGSMIVGAALGGFVGKSLTNDPIKMSIAMSSLLFFTGFLRNDYGELSRALGLAFVLTLQRTRSVRKDYPTLPHIKAMIRQGPRKPFPPTEDGMSPWKYEPIYRDDPEFKMTYALLSMTLVGSFCGGNVPILPAWIGGIVGAVAFASMVTGSNARGDLGRSMGMRLVGLVQLVLAIQSELRILAKSATVGGHIFDKFMIMDRKHRIKDRIVAICKWGYDKVVPEQLKEEMQEEERPERGRRR